MSANNEYHDLERALQEMLGVPEPSHSFRADLGSRLVSRAGELTAPDRYAGRSTRRVLIPALAVVSLLLVGVVVTPRSVLAGLKTLFGYKPDMGVVEVDQNLRFLVVPSPLEENGLTLTFENGTAGSRSTILVFRVEGFVQQGSEQQPEACSGSPILFSGTESFGIQAGQLLGQWDTGYRYRYTFPALPANAEEITLQIPCLLALGSGPIMKDLVIPLSFSAEQVPQLTPVVEILSSPNSGAAVPAAASSEKEGAPASQKDAIQIDLVLDQVLQWDNGTLLKGHLTWTDERLEEWSVFPEALSIRDAEGQILDFEESYSNIDPIQPGCRQAPWAYFIPGLEHHLPFKVTFREIRVSLPGDEVFSLDLGPDPQLEQVWVLDRILDLDPEHQVRLVMARMVENPDSEPGLELTFQSLGDPPLISQVMVVDPAGRSQGGGGGGAQEPLADEFTSTLFFPGSMPTGELELTVYSFRLDLREGWEVTTGD